MKKRFSSRAAVSLASLLASGAALAESQYGYNAAGSAAAVTATARLDITVAVPKLILLRVGASGATVDTATVGATLAAGIPGGVAAPLADGNDQPTGWDGTAPVFSAAPSANVRAWAWTNASGGGQLDAAVTTAFPAGSGLTAGDISVASTAVSGGGLAHPGTDTGTNVPTAFVKNTVVSSNWVFSASPAALGAASAGSNTQTVTYTATSL